MKNEQSPQSRMTEGLQRNVLRLSTAGCTADVGKFRMQGKSGRPKRSQRPQARRSCRRLRSFDLLIFYRCNKMRPRLKSASCVCRVSICPSPIANCSSTPLAVKISSTTKPPSSATRSFTSANSLNAQAQLTGTRLISSTFGAPCRHLLAPLAGRFWQRSKRRIAIRSRC